MLSIYNSISPGDFSFERNCPGYLLFGVFYMERAAVLIDGGYFEKVRLSFKKPEIDIIKFCDNICKPCERFRTYYYDALPWIGEPPDNKDLERRQTKQGFLDSLNLLHRVEVRLGEVQRKEIKCTKGPNHIEFMQKLVDVLLSVDMVWLSWGDYVEKIILVSGDRDFLPAVEAAREAGMILKLVYANPPHAYVHTNLLMACDERQVIDQDLIDESLKEEN